MKNFFYLMLIALPMSAMASSTEISDHDLARNDPTILPPAHYLPPAMRNQKPGPVAFEQRVFLKRNSPSLDKGTTDHDKDLVQEIRQKLNQNELWEAGAKRVRITARYGKVTLRGAISSSTDRKQIERLAIDIAGNKSVKNRLSIEP